VERIIDYGYYLVEEVLRDRSVFEMKLREKYRTTDLLPALKGEAFGCNVSGASGSRREREREIVTGTVTGIVTAGAGTVTTGRGRGVRGAHLRVHVREVVRGGEGLRSPLRPLI
jgi:hypothetical protein